jgi:mannosyltransferase
MAIYRKFRAWNDIWPAADIAWMGAILLLGLVVRLFRIDHQPFWLDEALTSQRVHLGVSGLVADSFTNRHMPTYFLLLQLFTQFAHSSDAWLRIPSALFGAMTAGVVFAMARRIGGRAAGLAAGLLMALSPLQVQYGQEARSYTLVTLLIAIALWGLLRLAQNPVRASLDLRQAGSERWGWATYVLGSIGALDVLGDAAPWLLASNLSLFLLWQSLRSGVLPGVRDAFRRNWLLSVAAIILCCVPFYGAIFAANKGNMLQNFNWIPELSWQHLWVVAGSVYLMRMTGVVKFDLLHTAVPVLGAMVAIAACMGLWRERHRLEGRVLLLGVMVLPLLVLSISLFKSMLLPRYVMWSAVPFFVLVGLGIAALPRRALPVTITANVRPGDTVFTADPNAPTMLAVLQPKNGTPIEANAVVTSQLDQAVARWKQGGRIWAVNGRSALGQREELADFKNRMAAMGSPAVEIPQGKEITILMFPAPEEQAAN